MVLPTGLNKASGLAAALQEVSLSAHNVVGIGDAENDHAFLRQCECAVAVANALPGLKEEADWVTCGDYGGGVVELVEQLVSSDLQELAPRLTRHTLVSGKREVVQYKIKLGKIVYNYDKCCDGRLNYIANHRRNR